MSSDDIQGKVTDASGNAVANALVALWSQDSPNNVVTTQSDSTGNYIFQEHPDGDGTTQNWHVAARDPNDSSRQFPSLHSLSAQIPKNAIPDSSIHRWRQGEGSGTTVADDIGSATGSRSGWTWISGTYVDGVAGDADGTDDVTTVAAADIDESAGPLVDGAMSVAFTIDGYAGDSSRNGIVGNNAGNSEGFQIYSSRSASGTLEFSFTDDNTASTFVETSSGGFVDDSAKHRVVCQKTGNAASDIEIWNDATEITNLTTLADESPSSFSGFGADLLHFAENSAGSPANHLNGILDDIVVFEDALSSTEIQDDYDRQPWS